MAIQKQLDAFADQLKIELEETPLTAVSRDSIISTGVHVCVSQLILTNGTKWGHSVLIGWQLYPEGVLG